MADITTNLQTISQNRFGEDVRGAVHDAVETMNSESTNSKDVAAGYENSAKSLSEEIVQKAEELNADVDASRGKLNYAEEVYEGMSEWPAKFSIDDENGEKVMDENGNPIDGEIIFIVRE